MKYENTTIKKLFMIIFMIALAISLLKPGFTQDRAEEEKKDDKKLDQPSELGGWRVTDFKPYIQALKDLEKINKEYSENILTQAMDQFATGLDILEDMEAEILKIKAKFKKSNNLNERWYWQEIDRRNRQDRKIAYIKYESKMKSITPFTRAINLMDDVSNLEVRKDPKFINFQIMLFQVYVSTQYDLHNLKPCIPILERYVTLTNKTKNDIWAYKYLSSCYAFMEAMLKKYKHSSEDVIIEYKQKKNRSLLRAAELKYGVDTPHYKSLKEVVELDEKKSIKLNEFR